MEVTEGEGSEEEARILDNPLTLVPSGTVRGSFILSALIQALAGDCRHVSQP